MTTKTLGICLAFNDIYTNAGKGSLVSPLGGVTERFDGVTKKMSDISSDKNIIISTAGFSKRNPTEPQPKRLVSLSDQLYRFVCDKRPEYKDLLHTLPLCWSTNNEIRVGIEQALQRDFCTFNEEVNLVIASHSWHIPRIWMYCKMYMPHQWKLHLISVKEKVSYRSYLHEIVTFIRDVPKFFYSLICNT